jgi:hypothetical protein
LGAGAVAALALGAVAVSAMAIGRMAIGNLALGRKGSAAAKWTNCGLRAPEIAELVVEQVRPSRRGSLGRP